MPSPNLCNNHANHLTLAQSLLLPSPFYNFYNFYNFYDFYDFYDFYNFYNFYDFDNFDSFYHLETVDDWQVKKSLLSHDREENTQSAFFSHA